MITNELLAKHGAQKSVDELMDYDPYLGRVSESSKQDK